MQHEQRTAAVGEANELGAALSDAPEPPALSHISVEPLRNAGILGTGCFKGGLEFMTFCLPKGAGVLVVEGEVVEEDFARFLPKRQPLGLCRIAGAPANRILNTKAERSSVREGALWGFTLRL